MFLYEEYEQATLSMNKLVCITFCLLALKITPALGQQPPGFVSPPLPLRHSLPPGAPDQPNLTTFNLDFPGGTPAELVKAIESAAGKPLNVIIPTDYADTQLPPLKMNDVNVAQLFEALGRASTKEVSYRNSSSSYSIYTSYYSFSTEANPPADNSVWYFKFEQPTMPPPAAAPTQICKFYQLQPYLNYGFTVDDITTAIQTGWKMAGVTFPPELNYHKETNLLIACGKSDDLATIESVLKTLPTTYVDKSEMDFIYKEANKVDKLQSKIDELTTNAPTSTEKNSGK